MPLPSPPARTRGPRPKLARTRRTRIASDPALRLLGLAARARQVAAGTGPARQAIRGGRAILVIVAADISGNTSEKLLPLLRARRVAWAQRFDRAALGEAVGRPPVAAVAVLDASLGARLAELLGIGPDIDRQSSRSKR